MNRIIGISIGILLLAALAGGTWYFFFSSAPTESPANPEGGFGTSPLQTVDVTPTVENAGEGTSNTSINISQQKVFRVEDGPIVGATVVQTFRPTTTLARYVQQNNGHVFDLTLDSSGAVPKAISNTTIPGITRALWTKQGQGVILQYLDSNTVKSVSLSFPSQTASTTQPVGIRFLPDGIYDVAVSPNGANIAYLLRTQTGVKGYLAAADGTGSRELFTLPLSEVVLLWPSPTTLLAHTKSAYGAPGIAFSINVSSGSVVTLIHASSLTLTADPVYSYLVYQTLGEGSTPTTYVRTLSTGQNTSLSFNPHPERCLWSSVATSTMYCATPMEYTPANYLDLWHAGSATAPEGLVAYTFPGGRSSILAIPGKDEGGITSTIDSISTSPDEKYLLFVRRGDRSLWGVRL